MGKSNEAFLSEREKELHDMPLLELMSEAEWADYVYEMELKYGKLTAKLKLQEDGK